MSVAKCHYLGYGCFKKSLTDWGKRLILKIIALLAVMLETMDVVHLLQAYASG